MAMGGRLPNNVFRIRAGKKGPKSAAVEVAPVSQPQDVAPVSQPAEIAPASERAVEAANDTAVASEVAVEGSGAQTSEKPTETPSKGSEAGQPAAGTEGSEAGQPAAGTKAGKKAKAAKAPKAKKTITTATGHCLCGCGAQLAAKRRFALGHDAKLHSIVLKVFRGQADKSALPAACADSSSATVTYLRGAPWMTDEIRQAIGL
ncbi:uncharacterized protein SOCE26_075840 [Sorangium cellulosum]|uniref:Uncharacterized protein n=1 Tax=Sorangium cellulosum TaxID=56 RepID=A0A2L0F3P6_SORCE|nr:hypothetical protein [Sorangium cellulosum]AUX46079.1 uncharacterized protein SOCE26_075840 [Sorangium cellulosum]